MKKCITKKALCVLLSALLTVSVFATCLVFSATADTSDALVINNYGDYVGSTITVMSRIGDAKTIGEVSVLTTGGLKDYNYFYLVACDSTGKVTAINQKLGRPDGKKDTFEIPEGGYVLLCHGETKDREAIVNSFKAIKVGQYVTLNNVDFAALATAGKKADLTGATFTVSDEAPVVPSTPAKVTGIKFASADSKTSILRGKVEDLIDGKDVAGATAFATEGIVLFQNADCTVKEAFHSFTLTVEADKVGHVNGGALSFYAETASMIGLPKDFKVAVKASDDGVNYTDKGEITLEGAVCNYDANDGNKNTVGVQTFNFTSDFDAKYVQFVITFGAAPYKDKPTFEFIGLTEASVNFSEKTEEPSEDPDEPKNLALDATVLNTPSYENLDGQWPCSYVGKVNDGIIANHGDLGMKGVDWAAFYKGNEPTDKDNFDGKLGEIVLDFGSKKDFSSLKTHIYGTGGSGIAEMEKVEFFVSDDNQNWTSVGAVTENLTGEGVWVSVEAEASGRYVKYAYTMSSSVNGVFLFVSECEAYGKVVSEQPSEQPSEESSEEPSEESSEEPSEESSEEPSDEPVIAKPENSAFTLNVIAPEYVKAGEAFLVAISIDDMTKGLYGVEATLTYNKDLFTAVVPSDMLNLFTANNVESGEWESFSTFTEGKFNFSYVTAEAANLITENGEFGIVVPFVAKENVAGGVASYFVVDEVAGTNEDSDRVDGTGSFVKTTTGAPGPIAQPSKPVIKDVANPAATVVVDAPKNAKAGDIITVGITLKDLKAALLGVEFTLSYDKNALVPILPEDLLDTLVKAPYATDPDWESFSTATAGAINFAFVNPVEANAATADGDFVVAVSFLVTDVVYDNYVIYVAADDVAVTDTDTNRLDGKGAVAETTVKAETEEPSSEEPSVEPSSEEPSSEEPSVEPSSEAPSSEEPSVESSTGSSEPTGDLGIAAIALLAIVTAGGVFAVRKFR